MLLSIIIPCYNAHNTIRRALNSVYSNSSEIEYIISDDNSKQPYDYLQQEYPNLKIIRSNINRGAGVARNQGMELAQGKWICFVDADDKLSVSNVESFLQQYDRYDIIKGRVRWNKDGNTGSINSIPSYMIHGTFFKRDFLLARNLHFHPNLRIYEDTYFMKLCLALTDNVAYVDEVVYTMCYNPDSTTATISKNSQYTDWWCESFNDNLRSALYYAMDINNPLDACSQYDISQKSEKEYKIDFDLFNRIHNYIDFSKQINPKYKVSVIVPLYNSHRYIENTLTKFYDLMKAYKDDFEVICTDDGSSDYDYNYLTDKFDNLTVLYNTQRKYMGGNRNRALRYVSGEWIMFLDHDDEKCKQGIDFFMNLDKTGLNFVSTSMAITSEDDYNIYQNIGIKTFCVHGCFCRTNFLRKYNILFNEDLQTSEDVYFHRRILNVIKRYQLESTALIKPDILSSVWITRKDSTFHSLYLNRCYNEEFFYTSILATIEACRFNGIIDQDMMGEYLYDEYEFYLYQFATWKENSKNFKRSNMKVILAIALFLDTISMKKELVYNPYDYNTPLNTVIEIDKLVTKQIALLTERQKEKLFQTLHLTYCSS